MSLTTNAQRIVSDSRSEGMADIPDQYWELLAQYRDELIAQAASIVGNRDDAEDVVQETFGEAIIDPERLTRARSIGAWLKAINRANAMDFVRRRKVRQSTSDRKVREMPARTFTTGGLSALDLNDFLSRAIEQLPAKMRVVVVLHYWQHLSCDEISAQQNIPAGTVKWLLYDAALRLHAKLKAIHPDSSATGTTTSTETDA